MRHEISDISFGILAALPVEYAAVLETLDHVVPLPLPDDPGTYHVGTLPGQDGARPHTVVAAVQTRDGTRGAAAAATQLIRSFPDVRCLAMPGIAAGLPQVWSRPVSPGDVVVATDGIVDYGHLRVDDGGTSLRRQVDGISADLLRADRRIQVQEHQAEHPWWTTFAARELPRAFARPGGGSGPPHVHRGAIGSGDQLLRSAEARDRLATTHGVVAFEMEGAGLAAAAHLAGCHWFMVRGIADFGDTEKDYRWHGFAALAAAAYLRGLLAECPPIGRPARRAASQPTLNGIGTIVEALLRLPDVRDDYRRRAIMGALPSEIRVAIPDNIVGRLHVLGMVQTCLRVPGGADALVQALRLAVGEEEHELVAIEAALRSHGTSRR